MLPVPTTAELAVFSGRPEGSFSGFAAEALTQATLLFTIVTKLTDFPSEPDAEKLARYAILELADRLLLEQPNASILASPYQSETIGSYSYSKSATAIKARTGQAIGLFWWDLAVDELRAAGASDVAYGAIRVEYDELVRDEDGAYRLVGPADNDDPPYMRIS